MTEKFPEQNISTMKSFFDRLSNDERLALAENEGWLDFNENLVSVATRDVSDISPDDVIVNNERVTLLRFTTQSGVIKAFNFVHDYAVDLAKMKPVVYGFSDDAQINEWTMLEWAEARDSAVEQALQIIDLSSRPGLKLEYAQIERGQQVTF